MRYDNPQRFHQEWLGYLQPSGLVVSPPALVAAQAFPQKNVIADQQRLIDLVAESDPPSIVDFPRFAREFLGWEPLDLAGADGGAELPETLSVPLTEHGETLSPTYAVPDPENAGAWLLLIKVEPVGVDLDRTKDDDGDGRWNAGPQLRFERLLRETGVSAGLLTNGTHLRLVYAPRGESSGYVTFPVAAMCQVPGRPIVSALHMLISAERLFTVASNQRLPAILRESRKYQNEVSTKLAGQVLAALYELLRGFQAANEATKGELLRDILKEAPQDVYGGLLGTLMRLVFVLYAEDRGLLSSDPVYQEHYSVGRLFESLRDDHARYPDTMKDRFGAWARLLTLFRLIHDGASHGGLRLPPRHGRLFDPDTWDFLEGRPYRDALDRGERIDPPRVPDGVIHRVLENLIMLDGERISYRALDVEQIGSVYEAMMGFELLIAKGPSLAVRPHHVVVDLAELEKMKPADRLKRLDEAGCKLTGKAADAVKAADSVDALIAALDKRRSPLTPQPIAAGGLVLQPSDERRRSGSHYTPRSLTQPIVQTTLDPILKNLGEKPTPAQILDLKVCDPAMGSGAFLVEACRYLGTALETAWAAHGSAPKVPPDEDLLIHARRLVASRCLYGVDKNKFAVDLAKLSLWLATLAKDHPFTFLDHALRHGDSLVGLTREQMASFNWKPSKQLPLVRRFLDGQLQVAEGLRASLHALGDEGDTGAKARLHEEAGKALEDVRLCGDLIVAAFFSKEKDKDRDILRTLYADQLVAMLEDRDDSEDVRNIVDELYIGPKPVPPFHWEVEFPEAFSQSNRGFDAFVGNPPFLGGKRISGVHGDSYRDWLSILHEAASANTDLVAHFYRRAFNVLRDGGALGLVATNTIAQGETRAGGLRWICTHRGTIYRGQKRVKWPAPGAAVVVSVVHVAKGFEPQPFLLDEREVDRITAFLFHAGGHDDPVRLRANEDKSFQGSIVVGMGFTFDDNNDEASSLAEMKRLLEKDSRNAERIFPYIGGDEVNDSPTHEHHRYVINFGEMPEDQARRWPDLIAILESKVKPVRATVKRHAHRERWWRHGDSRPGLYDAIRGFKRVLVCSRHQPHWCVTFLPTGRVFSEALIVIADERSGVLAVLQSRSHEEWIRSFGSTLEDRLRYTPSDCFETFPFPRGWELSMSLEEAGREYHEYRAALMVRRNEGLTKTYNRFHDPDENDADIRALRGLHDAMDHAVLDAYGWTDLRPTCEFVLDYEDEHNDGASGASRSRKKPWRYRWPDTFRDEVLARLLALNQERANEEALAASSARRRGGRKDERAAEIGGLFDA
jgi:hypothetical protein